MKESQTIEMYGRIHSDLCNVPLYLLNLVKIQIKLSFILRGSCSVLGFTLLSIPLNRCACLKISVYILWTEGDELMK